MAAGDLLIALNQNSKVEWRGTILGSGVLRTRNIEGWRQRVARGGNRDLNGFHGGLPGRWVAEQRNVVWEFVANGAAAAVAAAITELERVTTFAEQPVEEELCIQLDGVPAMVRATLIDVAIPTDLDYVSGYVRGAVRWIASDMRKLLLPQKNVPTGLPTVASGGLVWPLQWPLDWGAGVTGGQVSCTNNGPAAAWPVLRVTGPVTALRITNLDTGERLIFDPGWTLPAGQTIEIDTRPGYRTPLFLPVVPGAKPVPADDKLIFAEWFPLAAQSTTRILFGAAAYDAAAQLRVLWYDTAH